MKRIIGLLILLINFFSSYSQVFVNRSGPAVTAQDDKLAAKNFFCLPRLTDSTLGGGLDSIGALVYDRLRAKVWVRDTVLAGGHKWSELGSNIANASLTANGNYNQNWNNKQFVIDSMSTGIFFRAGGIGSGGTRRKEFKIAWGTSFGNNLDGWRIVSVVRDAASTIDSIYMGMISGGTGVLSAGVFNTALGNNFISYNTGGLININAKDSIWIRGAIPAVTADTILGLEDRGNGLSKLKKIPLPAATSLNNIGSGFRWVATTSGNIKTVVNGTNISWDSITNFNSLTANISGLISNSNIDTFYTYPAQSTLGRIWYDSAFNDIQDYIPTGGTSISLTGGQILVTNSVIADAAQVAIKKYHATNIHDWTFRTRCQATNRVVGFGPGINSIYSGDNSGFHFYVSTASTGFFMRSAFDGTTLASGAGPTINTNDIIEFTITRTDSVITGSVRNITTGSSTFTINKTYTAISGGTLIPNDGYWHFVSFGDNFKIISHEFSSITIKTPVGMVLGDSKSDGYYSGTFYQRYWTTLNATYPNVVLEAGGGNKLAGVYNKIDELYQLNPEWILIADLGRNDIAQGMTLAQYQIMYKDVVNKLSRGGQTRILHCLMPEDTVSGGSAIGLSAVNAWLQSEYGSNYINGIWDTLSTNNVLKTAFNSGDNVHLNAAGNAAIATVLINSGKLTTISLKRRTPYIANDGFITFSGNTIHAAFDSKRVSNYIWKSDTLNNLVPSIIHDDGSTAIVSTNYSLHVDPPIAGSKLIIDGMAFVTGVAGAWNIRDRTTTDYFSNIAQGGIYQLLANGTPKWYLDVNGLMAIGTNPIITNRQRGIFNIWEDRSFSNIAPTHVGLGFNLDSNTYTQTGNTTLDRINNLTIFPMKLQGTGSTIYTNPSSLYIEAPPYAGTSTTVTTPWSLRIDSGYSYFGNTLYLNRITSPPSTYNILVHGLTDSATYQLPAASLGGSGTNGQYLTLISGAPLWTGGRNAQSGTTYTVLSTDVYKIIGLTNTAARTITLPAASAFPAGVTVWFKDEAGTAGTGNIVINRSGSDTIDGATSYTISSNYGFIGLYSDGSAAWFVR